MAQKKNNKSESTGMYTAGFVLGIIGVVFAFIPFMYWIAYILGALALIFGIIGLVKKAEGHKALVATILGAVALVVGIVMNIIIVNSINTAVEYVSNGVGDAIENFLSDYDGEALGKTVDVTIKGYQEVDDNFWGDGAVVVAIKNISDKTLSFSVSIEAVDEDGNRIDESDVYAESLAPGQSVNKNAFEMSSLSESELENATYRIYRATSY